MTPREAANEIADRVFVWTALVLTPEDREEVAKIVVRAVNEVPCSWCMGSSLGAFYDSRNAGEETGD